MFPYNAHEIQMMVALSLILLGIVSILSGLVLLVGQAAGRDVSTIAHQAAKLAQKGLAEEVSGLVGNARSLVDALNQLARTKAGIGIFLFILGFAMLLVAFFMARPS